MFLEFLHDYIESADYRTFTQVITGSDQRFVFQLFVFRFTILVKMAFKITKSTICNFCGTNKKRPFLKQEVSF